MKGLLDQTQQHVEYLPTKICLTRNQGVSQRTTVLGPQTIADGQEAPKFIPLAYGGGPLLTNVELVSFYWGDFTRQEIGNMQAYLRGLANFLSGGGAPAGAIPDVWQYKAGCAFLGTSFSLGTTASQITDKDIQNQVVNQQSQGNLPAFAANRLFLIFTKDITFNIKVDGGNYNDAWCAYHSSWGKNKFYAVCPQPLPDGNCGNGMSGWESSTSHEIMEAITDPAPFSGWSGAGEEGGDLCAWQDATLGFGTVQLYADNNQQACTLWTPSLAFSVIHFNPWPGYAVTNGSWLIGDFNGDGKADVVHLVQNTDYVNVWMSNGDGTFNVTPFKPWSGYSIPNGQWLVGDFNGDGRADLVHAVEGSDYINVWLSNGDGTFNVARFNPWPGYSVTNGEWLAGDFDGDGKTDIVHLVQNTDYVNVWLSNSDGTFNVTPFNPWSGYAIPNGQWLVGDFNGDGRADLVHAVEGSDYINVWLSNGNSTFQVTSFSAWPGYEVTNGWWLAGDFNGDGKTDIVHLVQNTDYVNVWMSNGDSTFNVAPFNPWSGYAIPNGQWLVGDFNGDGRADLVHAVEGSDYVNTWVSNGNSTFNVTPFSPWPGYSVTNGLWRAGDINGDGKMDIVHAVENSDYANIWLSFLVSDPCNK